MTQQKRYKKVAVLMGGPSAEREVSLRSGAAALRGLLDSGYDAEAVDVHGREFKLPPGTEAVFIALHGAFGEDGGVQSVLDQMGIPYTGSGAEASQVAMDKVLTKAAFDRHGIPSPAYRILHRGDAFSFPLPAVVKPSGQGSSIGVHLLRSPDDIEAALADAFRYDDTVLVETYIDGRELTVGVIDRHPLPVVEIAAPGGWYGYTAKYTPGQTQYHCPAAISEAVRDEAWRISLAVFDALGCEGVGRVDFRLQADGSLFVLELNSIPGLTETSLLPKAAAQAGIPFPELCHRLMQTARYGAGRGGGHGSL
ncbi:MAG TPA: D-alanine--D-alanine ligase [Verrucomicrobia bacterium]|nr:D-alanine--D-alanine ligase [Verrucomicrobiota bacterium]